MRLVAVGRSTRETAGILHVRAHTVRNHVGNARQKLHARTRLECVLRAQRHGLL